MPYRVVVKSLIDGQWYARCLNGPNGIVQVQHESREAVLERMRDEIRYQLELCPCSAVADDYVKLDVVDDHRTTRT